MASRSAKPIRLLGIACLNKKDTGFSIRALIRDTMDLQSPLRNINQ